MATALAINDTVYVPRKRLNLDVNAPSAFYKTIVRSMKLRSVEVDMPNSMQPKLVAKSAVHKNIGVLLLRIGDYISERGLIDPLAQSIQSFLALLLPDDCLVSHMVRSVEELQHLWAISHASVRHVIIVGHGAPDALVFGVSGRENAEDLQTVFDVPGVSPKLFLSLCCETGCADFARPFSRLPACETFIAPFHSIHGATASQFCQTFLSRQLLHGETDGVAFRNAARSVPGNTVFRRWRAGVLD